MSKRSLIAYILCGVFALGICVGIVAMTHFVINDMIESAVYEIHALKTKDDDVHIQKPIATNPIDNTVPSVESTEVPAIPTEPVVTNASNDETEPVFTNAPDESNSNNTEPIETVVPNETTPSGTDPVETEPVWTVPGETRPISDDTGDGEPSSGGNIKDNKPDKDSDTETSSDADITPSESNDGNGESNSDQPAVVLVSYIVQKGDTLNKIARAHNVDPMVIAKINNIENVDLIYVGEIFVFPVSEISCTCCKPVS